MITNQRQDMCLKTVIETKDAIDKQIADATINMIFGLRLDNIVFRDKKIWEDYFGKVLNLTKNFLKANEHYRKYLAEEKRFLLDYKEKCLKDGNTNIFLATDSVGLNTEIDGFFSQIKSGIDTLATSFNPLLGSSFDGWHKTKNKEGILKSGLRIINFLENFGEPLKSKVDGLKKIIQDNIDWLTYIVSIRDKIHHRGGLKNITEITYDFRNKEVIPQNIIHPEGKELVRDFLLRTLNNTIIFVNAVLALSILIKTPSGMGIQKNDKDEFPPYMWVAFNT